ncbi:heparin-sulfate lyase HepC [Dysgonomonas sp. BGC7]|uniref:heparin-sulfate lyase HepC n=1 Tax=Dysgonomonas sp. BGC7 TaxID=1658008 RepID=UPI000681666D|nr:heparin-sulfate lyase HepC [Dysgonomonas sp. BGC7]MBD8387242.1 heparinase II/III family protein [Dysgonomonas sp. BGC7]
MRKLFFILILFIIVSSARAQELNTEVFNVVNLNYPGLEKVKDLHAKGKDKEALAALLDYYRNRKGINHPDVNLDNVKISKEEQKWADDGLKHVFFVHKGYQPSYFYGDDINWQYWPVQDNELRWQLHRTKWWQPMGKAYFLTKDEKYAKEWILQYMDWIKKNPLKENDENVRFAWRPLEVSHRLQDQTIQFLLFLNSPNFTPEFLSQFLVNYNKHAEHILSNYSDQGNHLLFEAQRELYAGVLFPELKDAPVWRKSGIDVLNRQIQLQVYDDGMQYELDPHYHLAAINIFAKAISIADANNFRDEFPKAYLDRVEKMIMVVVNINFPDYTNPMFSDAKLDDKKSMLRDYKSWTKIFPANKAIRYMASDHKTGTPPAHLSTAFKTSGFYVFRNGWTEGATQMTLKAGPPAFWHCQPDNGTFELYVKGRNFFPDAGSYVYGGDAEVMKERNWFRQTMVHKTLTLNNANLDSTDTKCLLWETSPQLDKLVIENPSYKELNHRRSVFFVDQSFFVIVDEAYGNAQGDVAIHYQMCEGKVNLSKNQLSAATQFDDKNNILVQCFPAQATQMVEEEGWVSYAYRHKAKRAAYAFTADKKNNDPVRFITVILPVEKEKSAPKIKALFENKQFDKKGLKVKVEVGKKKYNLNYTL